MVVNRIKWNYFNDIIHLIYLYMMVFALSQTYDMSVDEGIHYASNVFALLFLIFGVCWPIFLAAMLCFKMDKISENPNVLPEYKCFYGNMKNTSKFGLFSVPIKYLKKFIFAVLIVYCSQYENFVIGIILMTGILMIVLNIIYRPFLSKI